MLVIRTGESGPRDTVRGADMGVIDSGGTGKQCGFTSQIRTKWRIRVIRRRILEVETEPVEIGVYGRENPLIIQLTP